MIPILNYLFAAAVIVIALSIVVHLVFWICDHLWPSQKIMITPFTSSGAKTEIAGDEIAQALSAKFERIKQRNTLSGYGFLQIPALTAIPDLAEKQAMQSTEKIGGLDIKIKDVNVSTLVKAVQRVFAPPTTELHGQIIETADSITLRCDLRQKGQALAVWHSVRLKNNEVDFSGLVDELVDDVLFQILFDFQYNTDKNPALLKWLGGDKVKEKVFPNWRALQAFSNGLYALHTYQQNLEYTALKSALRHLERIPVVAPGFALGLYYYGIALAENREEEAAVSVFEQVEDLSTSSTEMKLEAAYQKSCALLRHYRIEEAKQAKIEIEELIDSLSEEVKKLESHKGQLKSSKRTKTSHADNDGMSMHSNLIDRDERNIDIVQSKQDYCKKLLAVAYAQLAHTWGTILAIQRNKKLDKESSDIWNEINDNINKANKITNSLEGRWKSDSEKNDVKFRILNAEGYSRYRYAQSAHGANSKIDNAAYKEECKTAIDLLRKANIARPNHYEVLQNMAVIYIDSRYGDYLDRAEKLYERTKLFVPNDYYQYEKLAVIAWRRITPGMNPDHAKELIRKGRENATNCLKWRKNSFGAHYLLARFAAYEREEIEQDADKKTKLENEALKYFEIASTLADKDKTVEHEYGKFLLYLHNQTPNSTEADIEKKTKYLDEANSHLNKFLDVTSVRSSDEQVAELRSETEKLIKRINSVGSQRQ